VSGALHHRATGPRGTPGGRWGRLVVPALCAVIVCSGPGSAAPRGTAVALRVATSAGPSTQAEIVAGTRPSGVAGPESEPAEDLVPVAVGHPYVWPSGIGLVVDPPTHGRIGALTVVRVRTTVLNESATPYDVQAVLGPSARVDGRDVQTMTDTRYGGATAEQVVPTGGRLVYETTFSAAAGRLTLEYRADFRFEAVVVDVPEIPSGGS
jgi:hypothetical protein